MIFFIETELLRIASGARVAAGQKDAGDNEQLGAAAQV
jgi:hypothetical protein